MMSSLYIYRSLETRISSLGLEYTGYGLRGFFGRLQHNCLHTTKCWRSCWIMDCMMPSLESVDRRLRYNCCNTARSGLETECRLVSWRSLLSSPTNDYMPLLLNLLLQPAHKTPINVVLSTWCRYGLSVLDDYHTKAKSFVPVLLWVVAMTVERTVIRCEIDRSTKERMAPNSV